MKKYIFIPLIILLLCTSAFAASGDTVISTPVLETEEEVCFHLLTQHVNEQYGVNL